MSSAKCRKNVSNINDIVDSALQKCIISHSHVIQSHIANGDFKVELDDGYRGANTELS